jgi:hypothetical protein
MTPPRSLAARALAAAERASQPCDYCAQPIIWAVTRDSRMPVDATPDASGNVLLDVATGGGIRATVLGPPARVAHRAGGWALYLHHKLTCPQAAEWTRTIRATPPKKKPAADNPAQPTLGW